MNKRPQVWMANLFCLLAAVLTGVIAVFGDAWLLLLVAIGGVLMAVLPTFLETHHRFIVACTLSLATGLFAVTGAALAGSNGFMEAAIIICLAALLPLALAAHLLAEIMVQARIQGGLFSLEPEVRTYAETAHASYHAQMSAARTPAAMLYRYYLKKDATKAK